MNKELLKLISKKESLHPDLRPYVMTVSFGMMMVNHPLVQEFIHDEARCALINHRYKLKTEALVQALEEENIHRFIFLHERPYRVDAFLKFLGIVDVPDSMYWEVLGGIWVDSENIWQNKKLWKRLWSDRRPGREHVMGPEELEKYREIIEGGPVTIYRGVNPGGDYKGYSWTLCREKAVWFAQRLTKKGERGIVQKTTLTGKHKRHIKAVFLGRGEQEVVCIAKH